MNEQKTKLIDRIINFIKSNPFETALIASPILFFYLLPGIADSIVSTTYVYIMIGIMFAATVAYIIYNKIKKDYTLYGFINRGVVASLIFLVFNAGRGVELLSAISEFDNIILMGYILLIMVGAITFGYSVFYVGSLFNKDVDEMKNTINYVFGINLFYLLFMIAEPLTLAAQATLTPAGMVDIEPFIDKIFIVIIVTAVSYLLARIIISMKKNDFKPEESKRFVDVSGSIIAILIGLLFGLVLMLIFNAEEAFQGFGKILLGGFNVGYVSLGNMVYYSVPIILTGLSVAFAFRTGLFNIGATGQLTIGAFVAVYIGIEWGFLGEIFPLLHWIVAVLFAMIAGGLWGSIPGLLKAYRNVNEVVSSIMLNYIAMYLNVLLIKKHIFNQTYSRTFDIKLTAATPDMNLDFLFPGSSISGTIVVAVIAVVILHIILNKTTFGYELKAVGFNRDASKYAGMNSKRNIVLSMAISGAIAGLAGAMIFLSPGKFLKPENVLLAEGFTGIAISLLGLSSPIGVLIAGLFFGSLQQGGYYLQLLTFKPEIIDIIIAVIIYMSALGLFLQKFIKMILKRRPGYKDEGSDA